MYEKKEDVHRLKINSESRNEKERDGRKNSERRPIANLFETKRDERKGGQGENEPMRGFGSKNEGRKRKVCRIQNHVNENRIREKISDRTTKKKQRFGIFGRAALEFHIGNRTVLNTA